jgi:hypothetical protein
MRRPSRGQRGPAPAFLVFALFGGLFLYMVAYFAFGWWGVIGLAVFVGLVSTVVRSEIAASAERQRRADEARIRYHATHTAAPQRRRRNPRGGAR